MMDVPRESSSRPLSSSAFLPSVTRPSTALVAADWPTETIVL